MASLRKWHKTLHKSDLIVDEAKKSQTLKLSFGATDRQNEKKIMEQMRYIYYFILVCKERKYTI